MKVHTRQFQVREDIANKFELMKLTWGSSEPWGHYRWGKSFLVMQLKSVFMADFDVPPTPEEFDGVHYTIKDLSEVEEICQVVSEHFKLRLRGYKTPSGGAHIFTTSRTVRYGEDNKLIAELFQAMKGDELYMKYCELRQSFAVRVTPKPDREGDFVGAFWKEWNPWNLEANQEVMEALAVHDEWLAKY